MRGQARAAMATTCMTAGRPAFREAVPAGGAVGQRAERKGASVAGPAATRLSITVVACKLAHALAIGAPHEGFLRATVLDSFARQNKFRSIVFFLSFFILTHAAGTHQKTHRRSRCDRPPPPATLASPAPAPLAPAPPSCPAPVDGDITVRRLRGAVL